MMDAASANILLKSQESGFAVTQNDIKSLQEVVVVHQWKSGSGVPPLEHLSMSSDDWSQAVTLAWLLQLRGKAPTEFTVDCLRIDMHCNEKQAQRSDQ